MAVDPSRVKQISLFDGLTDEQVAVVAAWFEERHVEQGRHLTSEGGPGYFFFVIDAGEATVSRGDQVLATFGAGDFFGEAAIFETQRRTATVTATSPMTVLAMFGADFAVVANEIPDLKRKLDAAIAERLPADGRGPR